MLDGDIVDFYPLISESLLLEAIDFASKLTTISGQDKEIILHCRRSVLFNNSQVWQKTDNPSFDVSIWAATMEVCDFARSLINTYFTVQEVNLTTRI